MKRPCFRNGLPLLTVWKSVLIHSAAGGVGLAAIQLAKYKKAEASIIPHSLSFWRPAIHRILTCEIKCVDLRHRRHR